ncbi:NAD(P)H-dependent flavin oxidoreductase [Roseomonas chloroacetimidivorans]|uniref:NAD(P)H-dependent flavin oxidoreductase n=1 Tax=Roseomonas chloroacetimidivorans TaxID=1766656 RepID=UPI003C71FE9F
MPVFAFSHCRDVIVEVTKAGGFGVLGAVTFSAQQLEAELNWIDAHVGGRPYGVDVLIPGTYDQAAESATGPVWELIPQRHRDFVSNLLDEAGIPPLPAAEQARVREELRARERTSTPAGARELLAVAERHPLVKLVVSALGAPPREAVEALHARGVLVGGLCGSAAHVEHHRAAGSDLLVAQGTEAGGHTGTLSTMVLVPQVVQAARGELSVLAAGGISHGSQIAAALAMGAEGVWCGTIWLGTRESELLPYEKEALFGARAEDAIQRKSMTGKPVRLLRSRWTAAWDAPDAPPTLPPPLQGLLYRDARARIDRAQRQDFYSYPAGQVVGAMSSERSVRDVMQQLIEEYLDAMERLAQVQAKQAMA